MGPARYDYAPLRRCLGGLVTFLGGGRQMRAAAQTAEIDSRSEVNETRGERASGENLVTSCIVGCAGNYEETDYIYSASIFARRMLKFAFLVFLKRILYFESIYEYQISKCTIFA